MNFKQLNFSNQFNWNINKFKILDLTNNNRFRTRLISNMKKK